MTNPCVDRIRTFMVAAGWDAVVLSHPHDVRYATGYHSILERWTQMEPLAAAIVFADPARPTVLAIPEANLAVIAVLNRDHQHCTCDEIRTFDMLNFCEVGRYVDPDRPADRLGADVASIALLVHGDCQPDVASAIAAALTDQQMVGARIGFDEHRLSAAVAGRVPHQFVDALDLMLRARVVKTAPEIARYRQLGTVADRVITHAGTLLRPGVEWTDVQAQLCDFMVRQGAIPVDEGAMLFGGTYDGEDFIPICSAPPVGGNCATAISSSSKHRASMTASGSISTGRR